MWCNVLSRLFFVSLQDMQTRCGHFFILHEWVAVQRGKCYTLQWMIKSLCTGFILYVFHDWYALCHLRHHLQHAVLLVLQYRNKLKDSVLRTSFWKTCQVKGRRDTQSSNCMSDSWDIKLIQIYICGATDTVHGTTHFNKVKIFYLAVLNILPHLLIVHTVTVGIRFFWLHIKYETAAEGVSIITWS